MDTRLLCFYPMAIEVFRMRINLSTNEGNHICIMSEMSKTPRSRWARNENSGKSSREKRGGDHYIKRNGKLESAIEKKLRTTDEQNNPAIPAPVKQMLVGTPFYMHLRFHLEQC